MDTPSTPPPPEGPAPEATQAAAPATPAPPTTETGAVRQAAPAPAPAAASTKPSDEERLMALCMHLGGPFVPVVLALVIWVAKKDQSAFISDQGKEAINFQLMLLLASAAATALGVVTCGLTAFVVPLLWLVDVVFAVVAGMKAYEGTLYRYPINWRFLT